MAHCPHFNSLCTRYFAGGSLDIRNSSWDFARQLKWPDSVWCVVDAVNSCEDLDMSYPSCHKTEAIANKFKEKQS
jgi:hypothetical protein